MLSYDLSELPAGRYAFRVTGEAQAAVAVDGPLPAAFDVFDAIFPIRGTHDLGHGATNNFGGPRGHMGQDMFAACGTRLVAARGGTVTFAAFQAQAGNYVVISGPDKQSYAYMHMRAPPRRATPRSPRRTMRGDQFSAARGPLRRQAPQRPGDDRC